MKDDYVLLKKHRHNRFWLVPGTVLTLPNKLGDWLVSQGIAQKRALYVPGSIAAAPAQPAPAKAALLSKPAATKRATRRCCGW